MKNSSKTILLQEENGPVFAVLLAGDYTAEHEHGIRRLAAHLTLRDSGQGIKSRTMTQGLPDDEKHVVHLKGIVREEYLYDPESRRTSRKTKTKADLLYCGRGMEWRVMRDDYVKHLTCGRFQRDEEAASQWADDSFAITAYEDRAKAFLADLKAALLAGDVAAWIGGGSKNPFDRGGLVIAIASRVPEHLAESMLEADLEAVRLEKAAKATGIEERIAAAHGGDRMYSDFSCSVSPSFIDEGFTRRDDGKPLATMTKHPVMFFLNPLKRKKFQSGWYTVEELDQWIEGKGPVLKAAE